MIKSNLIGISGLLIVITHLPLLILTLIKRKNQVVQIYSFHILSISIWGLGSLYVSFKNAAYLLTAWKISYCAVIFIAVFFYHTILKLIQKDSKFILILSYAQGLLFSILTLLGKTLFLPNFTHNNSYYIKGNNIFLLSFIFWNLIISASYFEIINYYKKIFPAEKKQLLFFLIGAAFGFIGGFTNFLPCLGINIFPYGNFLIPINSIIMSYAIFRHQLMEISIIFRKSFIYSFSITILLLLYLIIVIISEKILQTIFGYQSVITSITMAFGLGLFFVPLCNKFQIFTNKYFFGKSHEEILQENEFLKNEIIRTEKLKSISVLASGIAHEIKNPLTAVRTFAEHLPQKLDDKEFLLKFSKIVGHEVERIDGLVHELLEFAKPSPLRLKDVALLSLIDNTINFLNSHFVKYNITILRDYNMHNDIIVRADLNRLRQAFLNIFLNAIEAMEHGGHIKISIAKKHQANIHLIIEDSGPGITNKDLNHIFDPFYTTKDRGTGLGLSITQRIIQDHQGKIFVESFPGRGTRFIIELPIDKETESEG